VGDEVDCWADRHATMAAADVASNATTAERMCIQVRGNGAGGSFFYGRGLPDA
jgi:hypothetical protein